MFCRLAVVVGLVTYAIAQSITPQCANAVAAIAANPDANKCLAISSLVPIFTTSSSIVQPLDNWLSNMCGTPACSDATIQFVAKTFTAGCSAELASAGVTASADTVVADIVKGYPIFRKIVCLKHGNTFCITEILTSVETVAGPLTLTNIFKIAQTPPTSVPTSIVCTDCVKEMYDILSRDVPSWGAQAKPVLQKECGDSFVDGTDPSTITQGGV